MRISSIDTKLNRVFNNKTLKNQKKTDNFENKNLKMPDYRYYNAFSNINFLGGASVDLKQTVESLDILAQNKGENFPPDIRQMALEKINQGSKKTLIDVHKEKYFLLNTCYDLEDAKRMFPEFSDVLSDKEIDYADNSFIARVKKGEDENFNKDEDLALQILKLYWAQGFSLNDLRLHAGVSLEHTMSKLNIPRLDKNYAHLLKFSDKEYNERITKEMAQRREESIQRKIQENEGEPVYIPRGELSQKHKENISKGLINYYASSPDAIKKMSDRQKEYWRNHSEEREKLSLVMTYAWEKTQEGRTVQKYMSKFFKKRGLNSKDISILNSGKTEKEQKTFQEFWDKNTWAKKEWSKAVTKSWEKIKETEQRMIEEFAKEVFLAQNYALNLTPAMMIDRVLDWAEKNNIEVEEFDVEKLKNDILIEKELHAKFQNLANSYSMQIEDEKDKVTSAYAASLFSIRNDIATNNVPRKISKNKEFLEEIQLKIDELFYSDYVENNKRNLISPNTMPKIVEYSLIQKTLLSITKEAQIQEEEKFFDYLKEKIDMAFEIMYTEDQLEMIEKFNKFVGKEK